MDDAMADRVDRTFSRAAARQTEPRDNHARHGFVVRYGELFLLTQNFIGALQPKQRMLADSVDEPRREFAVAVGRSRISRSLDQSKLNRRAAAVEHMNIHGKIYFTANSAKIDLRATPHCRCAAA
jgi:hypothetical protein